MEDHNPLRDALLERFNDAPFNRLLGLRVESLSADGCTARFGMRP